MPMTQHHTVKPRQIHTLRIPRQRPRMLPHVKQIPPPTPPHLRQHRQPMLRPTARPAQPIIHQDVKPNHSKSLRRKKSANSTLKNNDAPTTIKKA